jgi:hypothetical protein
MKPISADNKTDDADASSVGQAPMLVKDDLPIDVSSTLNLSVIFCVMICSRADDLCLETSKLQEMEARRQ